MLHREALPPGTLDLLTKLSAHPVLSAFSLAGGTSLALRFGHRQSVDLDFFTTEPFDTEAMSHALAERHEVKVEQVNTVGLSANIDGVKVDMVTYRYPLLQPPEQHDGVRMLSLPDVTAMKLSAVTNRGAKKDFYDLQALIQHLGLPELLRIYQAKYPNHDSLIMLRSLIYFEDAESQPDPLSLTATTWPEIKQAISTAVRGML